MEDVFDILRHAEMRYLTKEQAYAAITENGIDALATMDSLEHVSGPDMEDCSDSHMPSAVRQALTEVLLRSSPHVASPGIRHGEATAARHRPMSVRTPGRQHVEARRTRS